MKWMSKSKSFLLFENCLSSSSRSKWNEVKLSKFYCQNNKKPSPTIECFSYNLEWFGRQWIGKNGTEDATTWQRYNITQHKKKTRRRNCCRGENSQKKNCSSIGLNFRFIFLIPKYVCYWIVITIYGSLVFFSLSFFSMEFSTTSISTVAVDHLTMVLLALWLHSAIHSMKNKKKKKQPTTKFYKIRILYKHWTLCGLWVSYKRLCFPFGFFFYYDDSVQYFRFPVE